MQKDIITKNTQEADGTVKSQASGEGGGKKLMRPVIEIDPARE